MVCTRHCVRCRVGDLVHGVSYADAADYVRTDVRSGAAQSSIAIEGGAQPDRPFLEIGCGALHLARFMVPWLAPRMYYGIDPNVWLREAALAEDDYLAEMCADQDAAFADADDFLWPETPNNGFAMIFSHSVLSHASRGQLTCYMHAVAEQLAPDGVALASLNIAPRTTATKEWTYPEAVTFAQQSVFYSARLAGLEMTVQPRYRDHMMRQNPDEYHHWIRLVHG